MAFAYKRAFTILHGQVGSADATNLAVPIVGTYPYFADVGSSGKCQTAYDIGWYADAALTTKLDWKLVSRSGATGAVDFRVRVPTISHTVDTVIYAAYGDASVVSDQSNPTGVFPSPDSSAHDFGDGTTLSVADSTVNANAGANHSATASTGLPGGGGAAHFSGSSQYISVAHAANMDATTALTVRIMVKTSTTGRQMIVTRDDSVGSARTWGLYSGGVSNGNLGGSVFKAGDTETLLQSGTSISDGNVHVIHLKYQYVTDGTSILGLYVDGTLIQSTSAAVGPIQTTSTQLDIGRRSYSGFNDYFTGDLDELLIVLGLTSDAQILAEANAYLSPSTFYTIGSEIGSTVVQVPTSRPPQWKRPGSPGARRRLYATVPTVQVTPTGVSGTAIVNAPTVRVDCTVTPTGVSGSGVVHAPTVRVDCTVTAPSVAGSAAVHAPTVRVDCTVTPSGVAASGAVNVPTVLPSLSVAAPSVAATAVVNAPTVKGDCTVTLTGVSGACVVNAPSTRVDCTVTLTGVAGTGAVNSPSVAANGSASVTLSPVSGSAVVNAPSVRVDCTITLAPVSGSATVNVPTIRGDCAVTLTGVAGTATVNSPSITAGGNASVTLSGVAGTAAVHAPSVRVDCAITLGPVNGSATVNAPSVRGDVTISIVGVSASGAVNAPFAQIGAPFGPSFLRNVRLTSPALTSATLTASKLNSVDFDNA